MSKKKKGKSRIKPRAKTAKARTKERKRRRAKRAAEREQRVDRWRQGQLFQAIPDRFDPVEYEVISDLDPELAQAFVSTHHYSGSLGQNTRFAYGLYHKPSRRLVGVATYGSPSGRSVLPAYFPELDEANLPGAKQRYSYDPDTGLLTPAPPLTSSQASSELQRLVLLDDVPADAESYFVSKTFDHLRGAGDQRGIVSYSDPRYGHVGKIYQALSAYYHGPAKKRTVWITRDGREFNERFITKIRAACPHCGSGKSTSGWAAAVQALIDRGAPPPRGWKYTRGRPGARVGKGVCLKKWLKDVLPMIATKGIAPSKHVYLWGLTKGQRGSLDRRYGGPGQQSYPQQRRNPDEELRELERIAATTGDYQERSEALARIARATGRDFTSFGGEPLCAWEETDEEQYDYVLNVLPPLRTFPGGFVCSEPYAGTAMGRTAYAVYAKRGDRYYRALTSPEGLDECLAQLPQANPRNPVAKHQRNLRSLVRPCGSKPKQVDYHIVGNKPGAPILILDVHNVVHYGPELFWENRCPLLAGFQEGERQVTRKGVVFRGAPLSAQSYDLANLAARVGVPLGVVERMLVEEGRAWWSHENGKRKAASNPGGDAALRELERRAKASADIEDWDRWISARFRATGEDPRIGFVRYYCNPSHVGEWFAIDSHLFRGVRTLGDLRSLAPEDWSDLGDQEIEKCSENLEREAERNDGRVFVYGTPTPFLIWDLAGGQVDGRVWVSHENGRRKAESNPGGDVAFRELEHGGQALPLRFNPDERRRRLAREGAAGDVESEAAAMGAMIRDGVVRPEHLAALSCMGDPAARLVIPCPPDPEGQVAPFRTDMFAANEWVTREAGLTYALLVAYSYVDQITKHLHLPNETLANQATPLQAMRATRESLIQALLYGVGGMPLISYERIEGAFAAVRNNYTAGAASVQAALRAALVLVTAAVNEIPEWIPDWNPEELWIVQMSTSNAFSLRFNTSDYGMAYSTVLPNLALEVVKPWVLAGGPENWDPRP